MPIRGVFVSSTVLFICLSSIAGAQEGAPQVKIAAPGLSEHGLAENAGDYYSDQIAQQLSFEGLQVITRSEVSALIGLDRQKALLGCNDESGSCAVELANALGTDGLLLGEAAKVGDTYRLSIRIISAKNGEKLSSAVVTGTSEDTVLDAFRSVAPRVVQETLARVRGEKLATTGVTTEHTGTKRLFWIPAAVGVLGIGAGAFGYVQAKDKYDQLRSAPTLVEPVPTQLRNDGQRWQTIELVGLGVGVAGLATAAGLFAFGSDATVQAGVALAPGGATVGIAGVLP